MVYATILYKKSIILSYIIKANCSLNQEFIWEFNQGMAPVGGRRPWEGKEAPEAAGSKGKGGGNWPVAARHPTIAQISFTEPLVSNMNLCFS